MTSDRISVNGGKSADSKWRLRWAKSTGLGDDDGIGKLDDGIVGYASTMMSMTI